MNNLFLVTRPEHDLTTFYLSTWASQVLEIAKEKGIAFIDCEKEKANRKTVERALEKQKPNWLFLNGHGTADAVFGHKDKILFQAGQNESLLAGKIVYALSCKSASALGNASVKAGALAYIGYMDDFLFVFHTSFTATPLKDPLAKYFLEPSNELALSLLKGNTSREATVRSRNAMMKNIKKLLTSESDPGSETMTRYLFWNWKHQTIIGNPDSKSSMPAE